MAFEDIHGYGQRRRRGLPGATEIARLIVEDGFDYDEVAALFDAAAPTVQAKLNHAGYGIDGLPLDKAPKVDVLAELALVGLAPQGEWALDALCAQVDNDIFFPEKGGSTREAKQVCVDCPVAAECLDYALANNERFGIWGGLSERERRRLTSTNPAA